MANPIVGKGWRFPVLPEQGRLGYVEGQNCHIAFRWAEGRYDRFPELASELAGLPVAVIAAFSPAAALAAPRGGLPRR